MVIQDVYQEAVSVLANSFMLHQDGMENAKSGHYQIVNLKQLSKDIVIGQYQSSIIHNQV